jgi:hypothetical protein
MVDGVELQLETRRRNAKGRKLDLASSVSRSLAALGPELASLIQLIQVQMIP